MYTLKRLIELIVTQWDVNKDVYNGSEEDKIELIVTQWDVNVVRREVDGVSVEN